MDNSLRCFSLSMAAATAVLVIGLRADVLEVGEGKAYTDIQSAIDAAVEGQDEVLVYDGTYEITDSLVLEKGITLRSVNGADATIVKRVGTSTAKTGVHIERVMSIDAEGAIVEGLTLTGGRVVKDDGAVASTSYEGAGAGVRIGTKGGLLSECIVSNNVQISGVCYGAGVAVLGAAGKISGCLVTRNRDEHGSDIKGYGFGVYMLGGEMVDSEVSYNAESCNYARGSVMLNGVATMRRCKVIGNTAPNAKYYNWGADWQATAGVYVMTGGALIENCLIAENVSKLGTSQCGSGGGLAIDPVAAEVVNCTIVGNTAGVGGGVWAHASAKANFINCIIQDNAGDSQAQFYGASSVIAKNCICETAFTKAGSDGNQTGRVSFKEGTYEPAANQISYNAGTVEGYDWLTTTVDLNQNDRIAFDIIDVGCYEYNIVGYEVNLEAEPDKTRLLKGTTATYSASIFPATDKAIYRWKVDGVLVSTASSYDYTFKDCQTHTIRLEVTIDGKEQEPLEKIVTSYPLEVYVVSSKRYPTQVPVAPYETKATAATNVEEALKYAIGGSTVYVDEGEYENAAEIALTEDVALVAPKGPEKTVIRRPGRFFGSAVLRRILSVNNAGARVSGFAIENGYDSTWSANGWGTGVNVGGAGGVLTNCIVRNCKADSGQNTYGAGVYLGGGRMVDCVISNNVLNIADQTYLHGGGAGVCLAGGCLENCRITGNCLTLTSVSGRRQVGSGVLLRDGRMTGCLVADNTSDCSCAGLAVESTQGGGIAIVSNCTFAANVSAASVGGVEVNNINPGSRFVNCCFANNVAESGQTDIKIADTDMTATYCFGPKGELPEGEGNVFGTDAGFFAPDRGNYRPKRLSPLVDKGTNGMWMVGAVDLAGKPRVVGTAVDIGCYENQQRGMMLLVK